MSAEKIRIAMILAAGYGTRMRRLTRETPKPLLPLGDSCVIDVLIRKLAANGIERVVVNLHYLKEKVRAYLQDGAGYGLEICYSEEPLLLGSGGGIAKAEPFFEGETILAANADVLSDISLPALAVSHLQSRSLATMALLPSQNHRDYGLVLYDQHQRIQGFLAKGAPIPAQLNTGIFTGFQILTPQARRYLRAEPQSIISEFYRAALSRGEPIHAFLHRGQWIDIGTEEFYGNIKNRVENGDLNLEPFMR